MLNTRVWGARQRIVGGLHDGQAQGSEGDVAGGVEGAGGTEEDRAVIPIYQKEINCQMQSTGIKRQI